MNIYEIPLCSSPTEPRPLCKERPTFGYRVLPERLSAFTKRKVRKILGVEGGGGVGGSTELRKYVLMRGRVYVNGSSIRKFHVYLLWDMYLTFLSMIYLTFIDSS